MLGLGRAIGETIAVVLMIGNAPTIGKHLFDQGYTLAAVIANEFGEARQPAAALIGAVRRRAGAVRADAAGQHPGAVVRPPRHARMRAPDAEPAGDGQRLQRGEPRGSELMSTSSAPLLPQTSAGRKRKDSLMRGVLMAGTGLALVPLVLDHLLPALQGPRLAGAARSSPPTPTATSSATRAGSAARSSARWRSSRLATLIAVPIGIAVALYLTEYGKDGRFANVVRYFVDVMTGVPSIVFGLFIYIVAGHLARRRLRFRRLEGRAGAVAADAPDRDPRPARWCCCWCPPACARPRWPWARPRWRIVWKVVLPTARTGPGHRLAAGGRARHGRDGAAAVHGLGGDRC